MRKWLLMIMLCAGSLPAFSAPQAVSLVQFKGHKTLVMFWRSDCAPCRVEMNTLPDIAKAHPAMRVALISLQNETLARTYLPAALPANVQLIIADQHTAETLKRFGNTRMALPFSLFLHADATICKKHYGIAGTEWVSRQVKRC